MTTYRLGLLIAGLFAFVLTLFVNIPADRSLSLFRGMIPSAVNWQRISGTVFHPVFHQVTIRLADGRMLQLDGVNIVISPLQLLPGGKGLKTEVMLAGGNTVAWIKPGLGGWQLHSVTGDLFLYHLADLSSFVGGLGVNGHVSFKGSDITGDYQGLLFSGELGISIVDMQLKQLDASGPLGNYTADLRIVDGTVQGNVATSSADARLHLQGQLILKLSERTAGFTGDAAVSDSAPSAVYGMLPLLGPIENGRARINWQTRL